MESGDWLLCQAKQNIDEQTESKVNCQTRVRDNKPTNTFLSAIDCRTNWQIKQGTGELATVKKEREGEDFENLQPKNSENTVKYV